VRAGSDKLRVRRTPATHPVTHVKDHHARVPGAHKRQPVAYERVVNSVVGGNAHRGDKYRRRAAWDGLRPDVAVVAREARRGHTGHAEAETALSAHGCSSASGA